MQMNRKWIVEQLFNWTYDGLDIYEWVNVTCSESHLVSAAKSRLFLSSCFSVLSLYLLSYIYLLFINIYCQLFIYLFFKGYSRSKHTKCINSKSKRMNDALILYFFKLLPLISSTEFPTWLLWLLSVFLRTGDTRHPRKPGTRGTSWYNGITRE